MVDYFRTHPWWPDETAFIVGGGPSLKDFDFKGIEGHKIITVNNAYQLVKPDVIFYADSRWWAWHKEHIPADFSGRIISVTKTAAHLLDPRICRMGRDYRFNDDPEKALSSQPTHLAGQDGGYMAINLAVHFGVSRIVLLGFDMGFKEGQAHWHEDHPTPTKEGDYVDIFAPKYPALFKAVRNMGIEIIRCTPSRLDFIPEVPFAEALALPKRKRSRIS